MQTCLPTHILSTCILSTLATYDHRFLAETHILLLESCLLVHLFLVYSSTCILSTVMHKTGEKMNEYTSRETAL